MPSHVQHQLRARSRQRRLAGEHAERQHEVAAGEQLRAGEDDDGQRAAEADAHQQLHARRAPSFDSEPPTVKISTIAAPTYMPASIERTKWPGQRAALARQLGGRLIAQGVDRFGVHGRGAAIPICRSVPDVAGPRADLHRDPARRAGSSGSPPRQVLHQRQQRVGQLVAGHVVHQIVADDRAAARVWPLTLTWAASTMSPLTAMRQRLQADRRDLVHAAARRAARPVDRQRRDLLASVRFSSSRATSIAQPFVSISAMWQ